MLEFPAQPLLLCRNGHADTTVSSMQKHIPFGKEQLRPLSRRELVRHEHVLARALGIALSFSGSTLLFPASTETDTPVVEAASLRHALIDVRKKTVHFPLVQDDRLLAVFVAMDADISSETHSPADLFAAGLIALELVRCTRDSRIDPETGLFTRNVLLAQLRRSMDALFASLLPKGRDPIDVLPAPQGGLTLLTVRFGNLQRVCAGWGRAAARDAFGLMAATFAAALPDGAHPVRLREEELACLLVHPSTGRTTEMLAEVVQCLRRQEVTLPDGGKVLLEAHLGTAGYPGDFSGRELRAGVEEQAHTLVDKARHAAAKAMETGNSLLSYASLLTEGGSVVAVLPMQRVLINLGREDGAEVGQRFLVLDSGSSSGAEAYPLGIAAGKAELYLVEVQDMTSQAELLVRRREDRDILPGDRLLLVDAVHGGLERASGAPSFFIPDGLLRFRDFQKIWTDAAASLGRFSLLMCCFEDGPSTPALIVSWIAELKKVFPDALAALYTTDCVLAGLPDVGPAEALDWFIAYRRRNGLDRLAVRGGVAGFPCAHFRRADVLENCRKALRHARLERDGAALFGSLSLTISGDASYVAGDLFNAVREYRNALLLDENNPEAANSLGVCMARLGKPQEAFALFNDLLMKSPRDLHARYNKGCTLLKLGESAKAKAAFESCLDIDPDHAFSLLRLGQIAAREGNESQAEAFFQRAGRDPQAAHVALREMAALHHGKGRFDRAQDLLFKALTASPDDITSLNLLARIYLEQAEDPAIAETLLRQSLAVKPDQPQTVDALIAALRVQGREEDAARLLAGSSGMECRPGLQPGTRPGMETPPPRTI